MWGYRRIQFRIPFKLSPEISYVTLPILMGRTLFQRWGPHAKARLSPQPQALKNLQRFSGFYHSIIPLESKAAKVEANKKFTFVFPPLRRPKKGAAFHTMQKRGASSAPPFFSILQGSSDG